MRRIILIAALLLPLPAIAEPAFTADELNQLEQLLDYACSNKRGTPGLTCSRGAISLYDKASKAQAPAPADKTAP